MACETFAEKRIYLIGVGMGNPRTLTREASDALAQSDLVIGSARLLEGLAPLPARTLALVRSSEVARELRQAPERVASVVLSGDVGFYSGASSLYPLLEGCGDIVSIAGVSSLSYLCARLHTTWQDAFVVSAHGRACNAVGAIQSHAKTFLLLGGALGAQELCAQLVECGLGEVRLAVGERLSYEDERICRGTASQLVGERFASLSVVLAQNDVPIAPEVHTPCLHDDDFVRDRVPMTKEEVRALAICKLQIRPDDTVWDIGAGTGSISVEAARVAREGLVFAVERDARACTLVRENKRAFGLTNIRVVAGTAPEALEGLPRPDRVFVGGSGTNLKGILRTALAANPGARICVSAITLETVGEALACARELGLGGLDITQVSVAKGEALGSYHLMRGGNPVYLFCAEGLPASEDAGKGEGPCA